MSGSILCFYFWILLSINWIVMSCVIIFDFRNWFNVKTFSVAGRSNGKAIGRLSGYFRLYRPQYEVISLQRSASLSSSPSRTFQRTDLSFHYYYFSKILKLWINVHLDLPHSRQASKWWQIEWMVTPFKVPRGINICCGQPHQQNNDVFASVRSRTLSGWKKISNGFVADDWSERRIILLMTGATAMEKKKSDFYKIKA